MDSENSTPDGKMAYYGKILKNDFSPEIKERLKKVLPVFHAFDAMESTAIPYISAWQGDEKNIWYEFVSQQFLDLMGCDHPNEVAETLRKTIIGQRIYNYWGDDAFVEKEVTSRTEIDGARKKLRAESEKTSFIEAVYKLDIQPEPAIWIKDQAAIESYPQDRTALSLGCLTIVTKEMATEEERQRLSEEKLELKNHLQKIHRLDAIGNLAGGIAEDLNQRVIGIQKSVANLAEGLGKSNFDDLSPFQHYQNLKNIEQHLKDVNDLSRQLMTFSGKGAYNFMDTDLTEIIKFAVDDFDFKKHDIRATATYHPALYHVSADRAFIGRALNNLLRNASRTVPQGGELILQTDNTVLEPSFAEAWVLKPGKYIAITVTIPDMKLNERDRQRIFEPFYTDGGTEKSGLSLATVYSIIKKHNGVVTADDTPQGGTIFTIYLPGI